MNSSLGSNTDTSLDFGSFKSRRTEETDQEGWMVSYADLITLLFVFFAVMLSISSVSKAKFELLTNQFNHASKTSLVDLKQKIDAEIKKENLVSQVSADIGDEGLLIQFNEGVLFGSAEAEIKGGGLDVLKQFSHILSGIDPGFHIAIEGHTDDRPIHTREFPSNWNLSAVRAVNVLQFMGQSGVAEKKMLVRAFADTRPKVDVNSATAKKTSLEPISDQARAQNRRVTLLVF